MNRPLTPLKSLDEALADLLSAVQPLSEAESVSTFDADRRVLAEDVIAPLDVPGFDNSQMDGYALRSSDVRDVGAVLQVTQRIPAGHFGKALEPLSAARIFTGAPMPEGADCVVMQEDCEVVNECEGGVRIKVAPHAGQWVRRRGEDVKTGAVVLAKGARLSPASMGLAASIGRKDLSVTRRPRVALFSTGDELVMPGDVAPADMPPGAIYNSNRFFLHALLARMGCEVSDLGIVPDKREATLAALKSAAHAHDLIITSGGVSVGEEDHIKPSVQQLGSLDLWQISMKPGKPFAYGTVRHADGFAHFVGLPGNPVSSFVTFLLLVRPMLMKLQGANVTTPVPIALKADFVRAKADKRREFLRARRCDDGQVELFPNQNSSVLTSMSWADGLVDLPAGQTVAQGDTVNFISLAELLA
jgi:molybdopterin molybdotransferase